MSETISMNTGTIDRIRNNFAELKETATTARERKLNIAAELRADLFGKSERTIYRYIETVAQAEQRKATDRNAKAVAA